MSKKETLQAAIFLHYTNPTYDDPIEISLEYEPGGEARLLEQAAAIHRVAREGRDVYGFAQVNDVTYEDPVALGVAFPSPCPECPDYQLIGVVKATPDAEYATAGPRVYMPGLQDLIAAQKVLIGHLLNSAGG
jgi:hypothetical protein